MLLHKEEQPRPEQVITTQTPHEGIKWDKVLEDSEALGGGIIGLLILIGAAYKFTKDVSYNVLEEYRKNYLEDNPEKVDELKNLLNILKMSSGADNILYIEIESSPQTIITCDYKHRRCKILDLEDEREIIEFLRVPAEIITRNKENTVYLGSLVDSDIIFILKVDVYNLRRERYILFCYDEKVEVSSVADIEKVINIVSGKSYIGLIGRLASISKKRILSVSHNQNPD